MNMCHNDHFHGSSMNNDHFHGSSMNNGHFHGSSMNNIEKEETLQFPQKHKIII